MNQHLKDKAQSIYWNEILELATVKQSSDELGYHSLFMNKLKYLKKKYHIKLKKGW